MLDNKTFELFQSLTGVEKRAFTAFVNSPYHNRREDLQLLWQQYLSIKEHPPGASRELHSMLSGCIEAFLAQRAFEQLPLHSDLHLLQVFRAKNLAKPLEHVFRRATARLENIPQDYRYYHFQYQLEWERYAATESQTRTKTNNLAAVITAFDQYTIAGKLRLACLMLAHKAVFQSGHEDLLLSAILQFLSPDALRETPVIALYYYCYKALSEEKPEDFEIFRQHLSAHAPHLPADENRIFLLLAINYYIRKLNTGDQQLIRATFDMYQIGLDTGALLENGILSRFAFKNIVSIGLKLEEFGWTGQFITRYEPFLEEKYRHAHRDYNLAKWHFAQKNYREAMPLLARVDESDLLVNLDSRVMLLKMYYETDEWDALEALLSSCKILLLRKKKVIGYHQQHYLNTLKFIHKLARLNKNDRASTTRFKQEIAQHPTLIEKEWLLNALGL